MSYAEHNAQKFAFHQVTLHFKSQSVTMGLPSKAEERGLLPLLPFSGGSIAWRTIGLLGCMGALGLYGLEYFLRSSLGSR